MAEPRRASACTLDVQKHPALRKIAHHPGSPGPISYCRANIRHAAIKCDRNPQPVASNRDHCKPQRFTCSLLEVCAASHRVRLGTFSIGHVCRTINVVNEQRSRELPYETDWCEVCAPHSTIGLCIKAKNPSQNDRDGKNAEGSTS
jgi:hypothetical protein